MKYFVEYKTDYRCADTGNVFLETISNKERNINGWVCKSIAQILVFLIPEDKIVVVDMLDVKRLIRNDNKLKLKTVTNKDRDGGTYTSEGYVMKLEDFEKLGQIFPCIK